MTPQEVECFKLEVRKEINEQVKESFEEIRTEGQNGFLLIKWVLATVLLLFGFFVVSNIYTWISLKNYITRDEFDKSNIAIVKQEDKRDDVLRTEINKDFSLPLQLIMVQQKQIKAKLIDKDIEKYELARSEEEKINLEICKLNCEIKRGGK